MNIDFLKKRAEDFWRDAKFAMSEKRWNSAAFYLEQSCQLYLKYYLFKKLRDFPKIHDLDKLLEDLGKTLKKEKEFQKFRQEQALLISNLNQAYITARYLPVEFTQSQIKEMATFFRKLKKFLKIYETD